MSPHVPGVILGQLTPIPDFFLRKSYKRALCTCVAKLSFPLTSLYAHAISAAGCHQLPVMEDGCPPSTVVRVRCFREGDTSALSPFSPTTELVKVCVLSELYVGDTVIQCTCIVANMFRVCWQE